MGVAIAEIVAPHDHVAGAHKGRELGIVGLHGQSGQFVEILDLDVLDPDDLVDIEIVFFKDIGDAPL